LSNKTYNENDQDLNVSLDNLPDAELTVNVWGEDSSGNVGSDSVNFTVDTVAPSIDIQSPINQVYGDKAIDLNVSTNESNVTWTYSLDEAMNQSFTPNTTISDIDHGTHELEVYVTDNVGNTRTDTVSFRVEKVMAQINDSGIDLVKDDEGNLQEIPRSITANENYTYVNTNDNLYKLNSYERIIWSESAPSGDKLNELAEYKNDIYVFTDNNLIKYNSLGNIEWTNSISTDRDFTNNGIDVDQDRIFVRSNGGVKKFDSEGNLVWNFSNKFSSSISVEGNESTVYTGASDSDNNYPGELIKWDSNGNQIWSFDTGSSNSIADIEIRGDNLFLLANGNTEDTIYKLDSTGSEIWNYSSDLGFKLDLNNKGQVFSAYQNKLLKLSNDGNKIYNYKYSNNTKYRTDIHYNDQGKKGVYVAVSYPGIYERLSYGMRINSTKVSINKSSNVSKIGFNLSTEGLKDVSSYKGLSSALTFDNSSLESEISFPFNSTVNVTDSQGIVSNDKEISVDYTQSQLLEETFNHDYDVQRIRQNANLTNNADTFNFSMQLTDYGTLVEGNKVLTGLLSKNEKATVNTSWENDYLVDEKSFAFNPSSSSVTLGIDYVANRNYQINNTLSVPFNNVSIKGNVSTPNGCTQTNNENIDIGSKGFFNSSIEFSCDPGSAGNPVLSKQVDVGSDNHTEYYFNTTDMNISSSETRDTNVIWKIDKTDLTDFSDRTSPPTGFIDGNNSGVDVDVGSSFVYVNFTTDCCTSSPSEGTHSASLNYPVDEADTTEEPAGGGGGGTTGPSTDEQTVYFGEEQTTDGLETFNVPFGTETVKNLTITNPTQESLSAQLTVGEEGICDYVEVRPTSDSSQWGKTGIYNVPAASVNNLGTIQDATVDTRIRFDLPNRTAIDSDSVSCEFETASTYGNAEPLTVQVESPFSLEELLKGLGLEGEFCIDGIPSGTLDENGEVSTSTNSVCAPVAVWVVSLLAFLVFIGLIVREVS
jgi:hypothetical protein